MQEGPGQNPVHQGEQEQRPQEEQQQVPQFPRHPHAEEIEGIQEAPHGLRHRLAVQQNGLDRGVGPGIDQEISPQEQQRQDN